MRKMTGVVCAAALATTLGGGFSSVHAKPKSEAPMRCEREAMHYAHRRVVSSVLVKAGEVRATVGADAVETVRVYVSIFVKDGTGSVKSVEANKAGSSERKDVKSVVNVSLDGVAFPTGTACVGNVVVNVPGD